jgi:methylenetetrahydrofolate reductase (NADPH)
VAARLAALRPAFFSCTYGAGGSTRDGTRETVRQLLGWGIPTAPHLSIGGDTRDAIAAMLDGYRAMGVTRIVALRGDLPSGIGRARFVHNAETLVRWIREHSGDHFHIEVAAYPEVHPDGRSPDDDLGSTSATR